MVTNTQNKLQAYQSKRLQKAISDIATICQPEKIFLLAAASIFTEAQSVFLSQPVTLQAAPHYCLLILKKPDDPSPNDLVQDTIENRYGFKATVTTIVYNVF